MVGFLRREQRDGLRTDNQAQQKQNTYNSPVPASLTHHGGSSYHDYGYTLLLASASRMEGSGDDVRYLVRMIDDTTNPSEGSFLPRDGTRKDMETVGRTALKTGTFYLAFEELLPVACDSVGLRGGLFFDRD